MAIWTRALIRQDQGNGIVDQALNIKDQGHGSIDQGTEEYRSGT
jgi:hypothetical protein